MENTDQNYQLFLNTLNEELVPAGGCTEPIAIAYAAATARKYLGKKPEHMTLYASGNLIKNAKGVYIPNGGILRGVDAAAILGVLGGNADRELEVLLDVPAETIQEAEKLLKQEFCDVQYLKDSEALHLIVKVQAGDDTVEVELKNAHTNIIRIDKNGQRVFTADHNHHTADGLTDHSFMTVENILDFVDTCDIEDIRPILQKQIDCNLKIAQEGLENQWGVNVGKLYYENGKYMQAYAAAASDARMSGCNLPVVIVSGSGNQGATASLPVVVYAWKNGVPEEKMLRALALSNLLAIHMKAGIGRLSAYCGVVCAAAGSGCAMTYMAGGTRNQIEETLTNAVATASGMVCDGAKPSCAAKIATSLESAIMAHELAMNNRSFHCGEGIVMNTVEETIDAVGCMASEGMHTTDQVILELMTKK